MTNSTKSDHRQMSETHAGSGTVLTAEILLKK